MHSCLAWSPSSYICYNYKFSPKLQLLRYLGLLLDVLPPGKNGFGGWPLLVDAVWRGTFPDTDELLVKRLTGVARSGFTPFVVGNGQGERLCSNFEMWTCKTDMIQETGRRHGVQTNDERWNNKSGTMCDQRR